MSYQVHAGKQQRRTWLGGYRTPVGSGQIQANFNGLVVGRLHRMPGSNENCKGQVNRRAIAAHRLQNTSKMKTSWASQTQVQW